jgi:hypothetical protein
LAKIAAGNFRGISALALLGGRQKTWFLPACPRFAAIFAESAFGADGASALLPARWTKVANKR